MRLSSLRAAMVYSTRSGVPKLSHPFQMSRMVSAVTSSVTSMRRSGGKKVRVLRPTWR
ncbi:hypothetical protein G4H13_34740 [Streptomyces rapamycinicus]|uniref:Uncharacterized protein n=1 Tax=Streptomyces rhizosphaericus TaxID=114699 RepID=A0A6G4ARG8_9ACTN|nr:hypothetical protein [Streptomyces rhizosphaericus]